MINMQRILNTIILISTIHVSATAMASGTEVGDTIRLDLDRTIALARTRSVEASTALNELRTSYWQYRTFRAELLPEITFRATVPSYNRRFSSYQNSDGSYSFVHDDNLYLTGSISLSQRIWLTGGTVSLTSSLDWRRQLSGVKNNSFMSIPVALTLNQPLFAVNDVKWDRKIEPVRYEEALANFISDTEAVAMTAVNYYFELLLAKENVACSRQNMNNAEKLLEVAKAKRSMGQISENDLLQIELSLLTARSELTENESTLRSSTFQLASFLGFDDSRPIELEMPGRLSENPVVYAEALDYAMQNNAFSKNIRRRQLEADYDVAKAKGDMKQINLIAQIGYTGTDRDISDAYRNLRDNRVVEIGVAIPILDWGKRRAAVKVAESRRELTENTLRKESMDFNRNLFVLVERFNNQKEQLRLADRASEIATRRYETNVETFMVGRISTLDLNDSQESKDSARRKDINELFYYWYYYYQLRNITLWDFENARPIEADIETILRN